MTSSPAHWWHGATGYEVYLRSFADGNGDGVGDLAGLTGRLAYLRDLGIDAVWITPFYPSPQADHGYDVADYCDVDPQFGTLDDFDRLAARARELGLRIIVDLVPNHTSSEHRWFREARQSRDNPYRDYYVWRDPAPDGGPPNNWVANFGGPAWTLDEATGQYYLHLFLPEQPDLNWRNPRVRDEFDAILRFWLERGVSGFRIDVAHSVVKHPDLPDNPMLRTPDPEDGPREIFASFEHRYDHDQPEVLDVYRRWNRIAAEYDGLLLGEVYLRDPAKIVRYVEGGDALHLSFYFGLMHLPWEVDQIAAKLGEAVDVAGPGFSWVLSSHDRPRAATRFGGGHIGQARALCLMAVVMGLPGTPFLYQGEELGLEDGFVAPEDAQDPVAVRNPGALGRDGARTPMPWEAGPGVGFTTGEPWLRSAPRAPEETVAYQEGQPGSCLATYRRLLAARRALADLHDAPFAWVADPREEAPRVAYRRGETLVAANLGDWEEGQPLPPGRWKIRFSTSPARDGEAAEGTLALGPTETVYLTRAE